MAPESETTHQDTHADTTHTTPRHSPVLTVFLLCALTTICILTTLMYVAVMVNEPPLAFPVDSVVRIEPGTTVDAIARRLSDDGVIQSTLLFKFLVVTSDTSQDLKAGAYRFTEPLTTYRVMRSLVDGTRADTDVIVTIPEGTRAREIARIVHDALPTLPLDELTTVLTAREGYLFPETYHFAPHADIDDVITVLTDTFTERMPTVDADLGIPPHEIVIIASILEREGNSSENMGIISGILRKRMEIGMPLQVDATLEYERGEGSAELSIEDLEMDSPYNTYTRKGLPPTPISNPGTVALIAALEPTPSPYLYYLTGNDGIFYYARTFEEHKSNKARHLR